MVPYENTSVIMVTSSLEPSFLTAQLMAPGPAPFHDARVSFLVTSKTSLVMSLWVDLHMLTIF